MGLFDEQQRPDRVKVVVTMELTVSIDTPDGRNISKGAPIWKIFEDQLGNTPKWLIEKLRNTRGTVTLENGSVDGPFAICIIQPTGKRLISFPGSGRFVPYENAKGTQ
jgi:hypothetical protein